MAIYDPNKEATRNSLTATGTGAMQGAATGAAVGSLVPFIPGAPLVGAGIGAGVGALSGALKSRRSSAQKMQDDLLAKNAALAEQGAMGLTQSQQDRMIADQTRAAGAQIQANQAQIARQGLAGGGFSGRYADLQRSLAGDMGEQTAAASRFAHEASLGAEQARNQQLRGDLAQKAAETERLRAQQAQQASNAVSSLGTMLQDYVASEAGQEWLEGLGIVDRAELADPEYRQELAAELVQMGIDVSDIGGGDLSAGMGWSPDKSFNLGSGI